MEPTKIRETLKEKFGAAVEEVMDTGAGWVRVQADQLLPIARYLKNDPEMSFDLLHCITGLDLEGGTLQCIYSLTSVEKKHWVHLKVNVPRSAPDIPSVCELWQAANWHEREAYDLVGLNFKGHPHLVRILCHDDWVGHPLRRDYEFPVEFKGIPCDVIQEESDEVPLPRTIGPDGLPKKK